MLYCLCLATGALSQSITEIVESSATNSDLFGKLQGRCNWKCVVVESASILPEMKILISNNRIVSLHLTLTGKYVDESCQNQTEFLSSSRVAKAWIWSTVSNQVKNVFYLPGSDNSSGIFFSKSFEGQIEAKIACTFNLSKDQSTNQLSLNDLIAKVLMEEVEESNEVRGQFGSALCYKNTEENGLYACLTINSQTKNMTGTPQPKKSLEWPVRARSGFIIFILLFSILFFPTVLCFFSPTYVCIQHPEVDLIVLDGPSHRSIRGWIANIVSILSLKLSIFLILLVFWIVILSLLLVLHFSSVYPELDIHAKEFTFVTVYVLLILSSLWCIRGFLRVFLTRLSFKKSCFVCDYVKEEKTFHQALGLEEEIQQHLQMQPLIIAKCWEHFCDFLKECWQTCCMPQLECRWQACKAISLFFLLVLAVVIAPLVALILCLALYLVLVFYSCPMSAIFDFYAQLFIKRSESRCMKITRIILLSFFLVFPCGISVSLLLLMSASIFVKASTIILSIENIASFTLIVLGISYCSRCYYSFTRKYDDLAAKIYSFLKKRVQANNQLALYLKHNKKKAIPKDLFDSLCQENMPVGGNICKLLLRIFIICAFSSLVYKVVTGTRGVPEKIQIMTTFLVAVSPMIVEIVVLKKSDKMEELKQDEMDEKMQIKVDEYIEETRPGRSDVSP